MSEPQTSTLNPSILLEFQEEERQRIAHALMDGPGQLLANALMEIEYALPLLEKKPRLAREGLNALSDELRQGLAQLKNYVNELQPPLLDEMGLGPSIQQYVTKYAERTGIQVECHGCADLNERYPVTIEIALFRILQEGLTNVEKHAGAKLVRVNLERHANQLRLVIEDNGRGFAPGPRAPSKRRPLGLIAMRDRAELLGGQLQLFSEAGRGMRVVVTVPYHGYSEDQLAPGGQDSHEHTIEHFPSTGRAQNSRQGHARKSAGKLKSRRVKNAAAQSR